MKRLLLLLALGSGGCLEFARVSIAIDVRAKKMTAAFKSITSDVMPGDDVSPDAHHLLAITSDEKEAKGLGNALGLGEVTYGARTVTVAGDRLDGAMEVAFERLADVRVSGYDATRPYRYCPPSGMVVTGANAAFRDDRGCVIWEDSTQILRVDLALESQPRGTSLVSAWRAIAK